LTTGISDTGGGGKIATGINDTGGTFATGIMTPAANFATGVVDTGGKQWE
jgi:hypothetical protein